MAQVKVEWETTMVYSHEAVIEVPDGMTPEEFIEEIEDKPHKYLAAEEDDDSTQYGSVESRDIDECTVVTA